MPYVQAYIEYMVLAPLILETYWSMMSGVVCIVPATYTS